MAKVQQSRSLMLLTFLLALMAMLVSLGTPLEQVHPYWLAMVMIYWILEAPQQAGLVLAFGLGLGLDLIYGDLIGRHAFELVIVAYITQRFRQRIRFFPTWQQGLVVMVILLNDRLIHMLISRVLGLPYPPTLFWLGPLIAMIVWPVLYLVLDRAQQIQRSRA